VLVMEFVQAGAVFKLGTQVGVAKLRCEGLGGQVEGVKVGVL
jgi:hypothetical protein